MQKISKRLKAITNYIKPYQTLADIGTDHAYLIVYALQNGFIKKAQAVDNKIGPLTSAKNNCIRNGVVEQVEFTLASGLRDLNKEIEVVVIAGMGGNTIQEILTEDLKAAKLVKRLILQANTHLESLRKFLDETGFVIEEEEILEENKKIYEIMQVRYIGSSPSLIDVDYVFGPKLRLEKTDLILKKAQKLYKEKQKQLTHSKTTCEKNRIENELEVIKEVLGI